MSALAAERERHYAGAAVRPREWLLTAAAALCLLAVLTVAGSHTSVTVACAIPLAAIGVAVLVFSPQVEITAALLLIYLGALDGFLKLMTGSSAATAGRDVFLWAIAAGMLIRKAVSGTTLQLPRYTAHVLLFVAAVGLGALNPNTPGLRAVLGGFRQHLEFVPLFFIAGQVLQSPRQMRAFFILLLALAGLNGIVGLIQFTLSPSQLASWGPGFSHLINGTGGLAGAGRTFVDSNGVVHPRPPALGSDEGFGGLLAIVSVPAGLALFTQMRTARQRLFVLVGLLGCVTAILTSQSRLVVGTSVVGVLAYLLLTASTPIRRRQTVLLGVSIAVIWAFIALFVGHTSAGLLTRYEHISASAFSQSRGSSLSVVPTYIADYPLGNGLGRAGPAAGFGGDPGDSNAENEFNLLLTEVGIAGLLIMLTLWLRTLRDGVRLARATKGDYGADLAALMAALIASSCIWVAATTTVSSPLAPFFWLTCGVVGSELARRGHVPAGGARPLAADRAGAEPSGRAAPRSLLT